MGTIYDNINNLYDSAGYFQRYGTDLYITIVVVILFFIAISYFRVMSTLQPIRADWVRRRCDPAVIPFAGMIYRPKGKSVMEATSENLYQCSQTTLQNISGYALQPFIYMISLVNNVFSSMQTAVQSVRAEINHVRDSVKSVGVDVMGRSLGIMTPLQQMLVATKAMFNKTAGIGTGAIYTLYGGYLALKALVGSIIQFIILILVALAAIVVALWILPFTWPVAAIGTGIFVFFASILAYVMIAYTRAMHGRAGKMPSKPSCFGGDTEVVFQTGEVKHMRDVTKDDFGKQLKAGGVLVGMVEASALGHDVYDVNGVLVTGKHRMIHRIDGKVNKYVEVSGLGFERVVFDEAIVYCPITSSGSFFAGGYEFTDWFDLTPEENRYVASWFNIDNSRVDVVKRISGGLHPEVKVKTGAGVSVPIEDIKLMVPLAHDIIPLAKVRMLTNGRWSRLTFNHQDSITKTGMVEYIDNETDMFGVTQSVSSDSKYSCHLVTDKSFYFIDKVRVFDFDEVLNEILRNTGMGAM